jgi:oligoribonuclease NrnB/cAMP/cGMP phosphodiesterase (DHH superfamily)
MPLDEIRGRDVFILDFCFSRAVTEEMAACAKSILVIDHHKTAQTDLAGFPCAIFDMNKSGARLAWEYFHGAVPIPHILRVVEDRDLWKWALPNSAAYLAYLDMQPMEFEVWDKLARMGDKQTAKVCKIGEHMNSKFDSVARSIACNAEPVELLGHKGHRVNAPGMFVSKVGELIYEQNNAFALVWYINNGTLGVSLRAKRDAVDVSELARAFGGGGHAAAAAFKLVVGTQAFHDFMSSVILKRFG